jgi:hypothetical protein
VLDHRSARRGRRTRSSWRQFVADDRGDALGLGQDVQQVGDLGHHLAVLADDLVLLQAGQALQALQDGLGLGSDRRYDRRPACRTPARPFRAKSALPPSARASISRTSASQLLAISAALATGGVGAALMMR